MVNIVYLSLDFANICYTSLKLGSLKFYPLDCILKDNKGLIMIMKIRKEFLSKDSFLSKDFLPKYLPEFKFKEESELEKNDISKEKQMITTFQ